MPVISQRQKQAVEVDEKRQTYKSDPGDKIFFFSVLHPFQNLFSSYEAIQYVWQKQESTKNKYLAVRHAQ